MEKRKYLLDLIKEIPEKEHVISYTASIHNLTDSQVESIYSRIEEKTDWKRIYPSKAVYLKRIIDHL